MLATHGRTNGNRGIAGLLLSGGVLSDAVFSAQTAGEHICYMHAAGCCASTCISE